MVRLLDSERMDLQPARHEPLDDITTGEVRVLIVDDSAVVRQGVAALVTSTPGMVVVGVARDGHDAVKQAAALLPDVILMDVQMPGIDGVQATLEIKQATPDVGVVMFSLSEEHRQAGFEAGIADYIMKDLPPDQILAALWKASQKD